MRENLTSGLTRGAGASLPLLYLFRLAAGKLHANYGSELKRLLNGHGGEHQMFSSVFWVSQYDGNILTDTDETTDCRFFTKSELPRDMPSVYRETINDLENYKGEVILK
jgi:hypothetical protein